MIALALFFIFIACVLCGLGIWLNRDVLCLSGIASAIIALFFGRAAS
jgi:hypothetical protein